MKCTFFTMAEPRSTDNTAVVCLAGQGSVLVIAVTLCR